MSAWGPTRRQVAGSRHLLLSAKSSCKAAAKILRPRQQTHKVRKSRCVLAQMRASSASPPSSAKPITACCKLSLCPGTSRQHDCFRVLRVLIPTEASGYTAVHDAIVAACLAMLLGMRTILCQQRRCSRYRSYPLWRLRVAPRVRGLPRGPLGLLVRHAAGCARRVLR